MATPIMLAFDVVPVMLEALTVLGTVCSRGNIEYLEHCCEVGFRKPPATPRGDPSGLPCRRGGMARLRRVRHSRNLRHMPFLRFRLGFPRCPFFQLNYPHTLSDERARRYHRADFASLYPSRGAHREKARRAEAHGVQKELSRQDRCKRSLSLMRIMPCPVPGIYDLCSTGEIHDERIEGIHGPTRVPCSRRRGKTPVEDRAPHGLGEAHGVFLATLTTTHGGQVLGWMESNEISHLGSMLSPSGTRTRRTHAEGRYRATPSTVRPWRPPLNSLCDQMSRMP
jgi:hypothetical protein